MDAVQFQQFLETVQQALQPNPQAAAQNNDPNDDQGNVGAQVRPPKWNLLNTFVKTMLDLGEDHEDKFGAWRQGFETFLLRANFRPVGHEEMKFAALVICLLSGLQAYVYKIEDGRVEKREG